eukprot:GHVH01005706.1.p1 GENE.GHVH01005706.1~~GHVH01005706.1.p1  ORF type:complete len:340 (+),score=50.41 GHVH01005706.1:571-1590(+)
MSLPCDWKERTLDKVSAFRPLKTDDVVLLIDIDGTLYWENQHPPEETLGLVKSVPAEEVPMRFPLANISRDEAMHLQKQLFEAHNQTLRGLVAEGIVDDAPPARERFWSSMQTGVGVDGNTLITEFAQWVHTDHFTVDWLRSLPRRFRKIAMTNASEAVAIRRLEAIGFNPDHDFDLIIGSEFTGRFPKPKAEAWMRVFSAIGVTVVQDEVDTTTTTPTSVVNESVDKDDHTIYVGDCSNDRVGGYRETSECPLFLASQRSRSLSHKVVMLEDSVKNLECAKSFGIGTVRVRNPPPVEEYTSLWPCTAICGKDDHLAFVDVVVNRVADLTTQLLNSNHV